ncbi:uncharacterized protein LY89DRAFT_242384 [Mollisia scopiformis]|uniref:Uncharacterized protein n=1 Tax=Mollisia scopiformis TaxID=149040 RepID=A0A194WTN2_MOLSC|nr:uncharacterized protein LY89DRAFT_242384 [Mollisia scopiformis]KUJ11315.1 hypothetical protein LY89DRAFT_242384 [Mollisia scopiformis]
MAALLHLFIALLVLMVDSAMELAFISSIVGYLHRSGANQYPFTAADGTTIFMNAKPAHLLVNEGHTSNGAAGTALVGVCFGGFLVLWWMRRRERRNITRPSTIFLAYTVLTILSFLLTLSALAYTFVVVHQTSGQSIAQPIAAQFQGHGYPLDNWAPGTWTKALLALDLQHQVDRNYLNHWLRVMEGYQWNLIPLFIIGLMGGICFVFESVFVLSLRTALNFT